MSSRTLPVHLPYQTLEALGAFTGKWWSDTYKLEPFVCQAIDNFVKQAPAAQQPPPAPSEAGYQWKQVFLPEGTRLRASFGKQPYYAMVEGAEIKYGERAVSPSCFANLHGSGNRNAWKAIWLRLPGSDDWLLADVWRSARKAAIARLLGNGVQAGHPSQENERLAEARPTASHSLDGPRPCRPTANPPVAPSPTRRNRRAAMFSATCDEAAATSVVRRNTTPEIREEPKKAGVCRLFGEDVTLTLAAWPVVRASSRWWR